MTTTMSATRSYIPGVFDSGELAEAAIDELRRLGLTDGDILVVARGGTRGEAARRIMLRYGARGVPEPRYPTLDEGFDLEPPGD